MLCMLWYGQSCRGHCPHIQLLQWMQCAMATWSFFRILACLVWSGRLLLQLYHLCTLEPPHVIMYIRLHTYHSNWITLYMHSVTPPTFLSSTPSLPCPSLPLLPISFALLSSLAFSSCLLFSPSLPSPSLPSSSFPPLLVTHAHRPL